MLPKFYITDVMEDPKRNLKISFYQGRTETCAEIFFFPKRRVVWCSLDFLLPCLVYRKTRALNDEHPGQRRASRPRFHFFRFFFFLVSVVFPSGGRDKELNDGRERGGWGRLIDRSIHQDRVRAGAFPNYFFFFV